MKHTGLKVIALMEGLKGVLAWIVGVGIHALEGVDLHQLANRGAAYLGIALDNYYLNMLQNMLSSITNKSLLIVTIVAFAYGLMRFVEAYGLWNELRWVEWFSFLGGTVYLPFEIHAVIKDLNWVSGGLLVVNLLVVAYMYRIVRQKPTTPIVS